MLAHAGFGQTPVSAVRPALGTSSASRERPGRDHPRPLGLVWPCPLVFQPLTLSVGVRAPAPETSSLDVGHDLPRKRKADSTAQDTRIPARIRSECRGAQSAWPPVRSDDSTPSPMQQTLAVKRWLTHRAPVSLRVCPRRASPHRGSTQSYAGSASREARAGNLDTPDRQPATRLSKRSTRLRFDYRSLTTAASFALHGARPTSAPELASRIGVVFQPEPR